MSFAHQDTNESAPRMRAWLMAAVLGISTMALYAPCCNYEFLNFDDDVYVTRNPSVRAGLTLAGLQWSLTTFHAANWHPLTWLSLQLDASLSGKHLDAGTFHRTNLVLHILATIVLFLAFYRLTAAYWPSALTAALFAWHPLHVESVSWVAERKDVLSAVFWMLTLLAYGWYVRRPRWYGYLAVMVSLALGLMAKPMLVTLPAVLLLLDYWPLKRVGALAWRSWKPLVLEKAPLILLVAGASIMTLVAQERGGTINSLEKLPFGLRVENAIVAYTAYIDKTLFPIYLAPLYPHPYAGYPLGTVLAAAMVIVLLSTLFVRLSSRRPYFLCGWLWFLGTLVPVIGIVQVGIQSWADRYTYIPLVGLFIIASWALADLAAHSLWRPVAATIGFGLLIGCALVTHRQLQYWRNSLLLWQHAVIVTPECADAYNSLGYALATSRQPQLSLAIATFQQGLQIDSRHPKLLNNLGRAYEQCKRKAEAEQCYRQAIEAEQTYVPARYNLGRLLLESDRIEEAARELEQALELQPDNPGARFTLGRVRGRQKRYASAVAELRLAYELDPYRAVDMKEKLDAASIEARRQIELDPNSFPAHVALAEILLRQNNSGEALEHLQEAHHLKPDDPVPLALIKQAQVARP